MYLKRADHCLSQICGQLVKCQGQRYYWCSSFDFSLKLEDYSVATLTLQTNNQLSIFYIYTKAFFRNYFPWVSRVLNRDIFFKHHSLLFLLFQELKKCSWTSQWVWWIWVKTHWLLVFECTTQRRGLTHHPCLATAKRSMRTTRWRMLRQPSLPYAVETWTWSYIYLYTLRYLPAL